MKTRLTDVLGIDHPVMLAGMGGVSYSPLVTAVPAINAIHPFANAMCSGTASGRA